MKKLFTFLCAFIATLAYAQQPDFAAIEAAKHAKVINMLQAKANGTGTNQVTDTVVGAPEQDCMGAIVVCQPVYYQYNSYSGQGNIPYEINSAISCLGAGELNSVWYKILVVNDGLLGFNLTPNDTLDDYDWAVFNMTNASCGDIYNDATLQVSCNFSGSTFPTATTGPNGGNNPQDEPMIPVFAGEVYYINVSNFSSTASGYTIDFGIATIELGHCSFIYGNLYLDNNTNCDLDPSDPPVANQVVYALPGPYYGLSDANGLYRIGIPQNQTGIYQLFTQPLNSSIVQECPANPSFLTVNVTNADSLYPGNNFAYVANPTYPSPCPQLYVDNSTLGFYLACCGGTRTIRICNYGNTAATNVVLDVEYQTNSIVFDQVTFQNNTMPYTQNGNHYYFNFPTLQVGGCYYLDLHEVILDSAAAVNNLSCVLAHVTPDDPCGPSVGWDGSDIHINTACDNNNNVVFTLVNTGVANMSVPLNYTVYRGSSVFDTGTFQLTAGQSADYTYPANGDFYVMQAEQSHGNPTGIQPAGFVDNCGDSTYVQTVDFNNYNQGYDQANAWAYDCVMTVPNLNSYDPNDKVAIPAGLGPQHFISGDDVIEYKIRFQNTGTGPASKVVLVDTLDIEYLEPLTLHIGTSNYPFTAELSGTGVLVFTFDNIMLPPASTDSIGSIGYITYRIAQRWDNPVTYTINNKAYIYFDENPAIITNNAFHNVKENYATAIAEMPVGKNGLGVIAFPNPTNGNITIRLNTLAAGQSYGLQVFNSAGMLVKELANQKVLETAIDITTLPVGLYTYRVATTAGKTAVGRFVKE